MPLVLCWWASWAISWVSHPNTRPLIIPQGVGRHQETVWRWWSIPYFRILKVQPAMRMEPNCIFPKINWEHAMHITLFKHTLHRVFLCLYWSQKNSRHLRMFLSGLQHHGSAGPWSAAILEVGPQLPRTTSRDGTPGQTDAWMESLAHGFLRCS